MARSGLCGQCGPARIGLMQIPAHHCYGTGDRLAPPGVLGGFNCDCPCRAWPRPDERRFAGVTPPELPRQQVELCAAQTLMMHLPNFSRPAVGSVLEEPELQQDLFEDAVRHLATGDDAQAERLHWAMGVLGTRTAFLEAIRLGR